MLEKEAAFQMLSEPKDYTFKYLVIQSAGQIGFEWKHYEAARQILELGLFRNQAKPNSDAKATLFRGDKEHTAD
ncbi:MAG: hypothetical protein AAF849_09435 [Bacteroidota bacterium]